VSHDYIYYLLLCLSVRYLNNEIYKSRGIDIYIYMCVL